MPKHYGSCVTSHEKLHKYIEALMQLHFSLITKQVEMRIQNASAKGLRDIRGCCNVTIPGSIHSSQVLPEVTFEQRPVGVTLPSPQTPAGVWNPEIWPIKFGSEDAKGVWENEIWEYLGIIVAGSWQASIGCSITVQQV